ncbi:MULTISPECIES: hypothetical protein [unclassified Sphingobacterium]|uniref:hypothetical protein n=1 Tax=unclassified Sphingobacterium TaxID=2609468 RepID=UPI0025D664DA|nr:MULTISPECIES: hypothetical protein [unclassified Sphingobacterium]
MRIIHYLDPDQVFNAYKKLKHYFFYDNTTLFVRKSIAKFEKENFDGISDIDKIKTILYRKIQHTFNKLSNYQNVPYTLIKTHLLPKKIKRNASHIVTTNSKELKEIELERLNVYADVPIEIHVLSTLWVMYAGRFLAPLLSESCYANKLNLDINEETEDPYENLKLFKPYFVQYQHWRDDAILKAENLLDEKRNVTILSLDVKDYYHSISLDFDKIKKDLKKNIRDYAKKKKEFDVERFLELSIDLTDMLFIVHKLYSVQLRDVYPSNKKQDRKLKNKYPLPIGLLSSCLLGNYYLKDLDKMIVENINPAFYGRYVDDLMFVFSDLTEHFKPDLNSPTLSFLYRNFYKKGILDIHPDGKVQEVLFTKVDDSWRYKEYCDDLKVDEINIFKDFGIYKDDIIKQLVNSIKFTIRNPINIDPCIDKTENIDLGYSNLEIQVSKTVLHYFDYKESRAVLNIFKKRLREQRSEFRFLPDEDEISEQFDEEAFNLKYNDSENKFRSIEDFSENKYGASKFLAKKIFAVSFGDSENDDIANQQILTFFKESTALNFYSLWEKVATYFVISNRPDNLLIFKRNVENAIDKLEISKDSIGNENISSDYVKSNLKKSLINYFKISVSIALSLNPKLEIQYTNGTEKELFKELHLDALMLRKSNLFRTSLIKVPGINYLRFQDPEFSLLGSDYNSYFHLENKEIEIDLLIANLAPNYIPFHEINILKIVSRIANIDITDLKNNKNGNNQKNNLSEGFNVNAPENVVSENRSNDSDLQYDKINSIPDEAFEWYYRCNYGWKKNFNSDIKKRELKKKYFTVYKEDEISNDLKYNEIEIHGENIDDFDDKVDKRIAIANIKVDERNVERSYLKMPNLDRKRRKTIFKLLNEADRHESDLIIFPEVSIPYSWLRLLAERSHKRYMGIVAGLEHWINNNNIAFNFMVTILPFKVHENVTSLIKIRLKNHYSPKEKYLLTGYRLIVPKQTLKDYKMSYDLFHWRKTYFSVYNCFELADIYHRSLFKSKVDFIVASELNPDTEYFSDVAGAWVRDVHSYFIQVNSSHYGDSRLIQPSKSYKKDLIQVKGGENSTILVGNMEIERLRNFQLMEYHLQKDSIEKEKYHFKPTPPDFDRDNVTIRMNDRKIGKSIL